MMCFMIISLSAAAMQINLVEGVPVANPRQLVEEGIKLGNAQLLRKAWSHYESALKLSGGSDTGYLELGQIYFHLSLLGVSTEEDFETAEFFARKAIFEDPHDADAHRSLGLILAGRGAFLDALDQLNVALHLNPANEYLIYDLAALHLALHQPKKTIEFLEGRNHKSAWAYVVLAMAWSQQNSRGRAILNLYKARQLGFSHYWIDRMLEQFSEELKMNFN